MREHPLPTVQIRTPLGSTNAVSSLGAKIKQSDGSEFPLLLTHAKATVNIDWNSGDAITVDFETVGGFDIELTAGVRFITLNGVRYRLVEDQPPTPYKESRVESASLPWRPSYVI
jgi:hypothetical protein